MTLVTEDREWREQQKRGRTTTSRTRGIRFAPLNAVVHGGWLARLSARETKVWMTIYCMADHDNRAVVSHGTIARLTGLHRENVARTTARLEASGVIRVVVRGRMVRQTGKRTANVYELLVPPPTPNSADAGTNADPE